jgi:hypothetical protein
MSGACLVYVLCMVCVVCVLCECCVLRVCVCVCFMDVSMVVDQSMALGSRAQGSLGLRFDSADVRQESGKCSV